MGGDAIAGWVLDEDEEMGICGHVEGYLWDGGGHEEEAMSWHCESWDIL